MLYGMVKLDEYYDKDGLIRLIKQIGYDVNSYAPQENIVEKYGYETICASFNGWVWYQDNLENATKEELQNLCMHLLARRLNDSIMGLNVERRRKDEYVEKIKESYIMTDKQIREVFWKYHPSNILKEN